MEYRERLENLKKKISTNNELNPTIKNIINCHKKHIKRLYNIIFISVNLNIFLIFYYIKQK